jgi:SAM-dependent methyltransferase
LTAPVIARGVKQPIDIANRETVAFLAPHLPARGRVLEVGCGEGHIALLLRDLGHQVLGLDSDAETVARAQQHGAPVVHARWPEFTGAPVDAVAFTRSLHHIGPLQPAIERARQILVPRGALLVEDFAFDEADEATLVWFTDVLRANRARIDPAPGTLLATMLDVADPVARWREHHDRDVHGMQAMARALAEQFRVEETLSVPYLYRYLIPALPATSDAARFVEEVLQDEAARGESGAIALIGRRVVGSSR